MDPASRDQSAAEAVDVHLTFIGGRRCLDFTATLRKRFAEPIETLTDCRALLDWLIAAELLPTSGAECRSSDLEHARALREAIYRAVTRMLAGNVPAQTDVERINQLAARADLAPQLVPAGARGSVRNEPLPSAWAGTPTVDAALATIARDAVALLSSNALGRVKACGNPHCSLLFQDDSQGRRRTWCSMERCGNRMKIAGYRNRLKVANNAAHQ